MALLGLLGPIGWPELIIILFVVLLLFGPKRLPDMAKAIGQSVRELRKSAEGRDEEAKSSQPAEEKKEE
jgi:sec-independent protein translocase protein TatA